MAFKASSVGSDTAQYLYRYEHAQEMMAYSAYRSEWAYNIIGIFFKEILHTDWQVYLMVISLVVCAGLAIFIYHFSDNAILSLYIYMTIGLFTMNMSGLRQSLSIAVCMMLLAYLCTIKRYSVKQYIIIGIVILFAYFIHNSAFCFIPILFVMNKRIGKKTAVIFQLIAASALVLRQPIVSLGMRIVPSRYTNYDVGMTYAINPLVILITMFIPLVCLVFDKTEEDGLYNQKISLMYIFSAFNILFTALSISNNQIGRLAYFFSPCYMVLIPHMLSKQGKNNKVIISFALVSLCAVYFILSTNGGTLKIGDYRFFWAQ